VQRRPVLSSPRWRDSLFHSVSTEQCFVLEDARLRFGNEPLIEGRRFARPSQVTTLILLAFLVGMLLLGVVPFRYASSPSTATSARCKPGFKAHQKEWARHSFESGGECPATDEIHIPTLQIYSPAQTDYRKGSLTKRRTIAEALGQSARHPASGS